MACAWSWIEHGPTTTTRRSSAPCSTREMALRLCSTRAWAEAGVGSHSCSKAGVISGRTARMRVSSMRVVSWVWSGEAAEARTWAVMVEAIWVWGSGLLQEDRLQHELTLVGLAVHVVVAVVVHQADALDLGAFLQHRGAALDLQVLDQQHGVAVGQGLAVGVTDHAVASGADELVAVGVGVFKPALGAGGRGGTHGGAVRGNDESPIV